MSGAISATTLLAVGAGVAGGAVLAGAMAPKPKMPAPQKPEAPPQASKTPDQAAVRAQPGSGATVGGTAASTLLTGSTGINADQLNLGKSTLLGQ